jgi:dienelactone hydrolase
LLFSYRKARVARGTHDSQTYFATGPIAWAVPSTDKLFSPEARARVVEICTEKKQPFNMQIFSGVGHGFAVSL